ncbi:hypothetical protein F4X10_00170 [Candidatus Poribacteria bacterium]|nr:hypothetical protein [Candidatus Poribacteria bacterium]
MPFLNVLPLHVWVLFGFATLGFCYCLYELYTYRAKIEMLSKYREALVEFHNNVEEGKGVNPELSIYLLENAVKIKSESITRMTTYDPVLRISTDIVNTISDIVMLECHDFTIICQKVENMLILNIGTFKDIMEKIRSQIINPIYLLKKGVSTIFDMIPIISLTPRKIKDFLSNLIAFISIVNTILSLYLKKSFLLSIIRFFVN